MGDHEALLHELETAHAALIEATLAFERMLRNASPDPVLLATVRLKLTSANSRRRLLLEKIFAALGPLSEGDAERIRQLRAEGVEAVLRSSRHIATWTAGEVMHNWRGYVAASAHVPASVRKNIRNDQRVLRPLLAPRAVPAQPAQPSNISSSCAG